MPPQYYLVSTLAPLLDGRVSTAEQKERVGRLARGAFGRLDVNPVPLTLLPGQEAEVKRVGKGWSCLVYEGDEARGGVKGRRHRSLVKFEKPGVRPAL